MHVCLPKHSCSANWYIMSLILVICQHLNHFDTRVVDNPRNIIIILISYCLNILQNPASGDALTKLQDDIDETKIVLVSKILQLIVHCSSL